MSTSAFSGRFNLKTAFNAINATEMLGETTAVLISLRGEYQMANLGGFKAETIANLRQQGFTVSSVLFLEEVSTQAPWHVAQLCRLCQELNNIFDQPFGGADVLLIGDFTQLGPVLAGHTITQAVMDIHANEEVQQWMSKKRREDSKKKHSKSLIPPKNKDKNRSGVDSPYGLGVDIMTKARWFELTQQQRSQTDPKHTGFVQRTYYGERITLDDIKNNYKLLSSTDFQDPDWIKAPMLVSTNRERYSLTHSRAVQFAKLTGTVVLRWLRPFKEWCQKPDPDCVHDAMSDVCFYEYYVEGCDGFITENIFKDLRVVNGLPVRFHSVKLRPQVEEVLEMQMHHAEPGTVLTLQEPPISINVEVFVDEETPEPIVNALKEFSIEVVTKNNTNIIIPITPKSCRWDQGLTPIYGSMYFSASKARFSRHFPVEPAFAVTVHKSEGRTMKKVIIAMSHCKVDKCNFSYEQLHVAFSRVTEAEGIRLLLTGEHEADKWMSISYIMDHKQDPSVQFYFAGFRERVRPGTDDPNIDWQSNEWSAKRANEEFLKVLHKQGQHQV